MKQHRLHSAILSVDLGLGEDTAEDTQVTTPELQTILSVSHRQLIYALYLMTDFIKKKKSYWLQEYWNGIWLMGTIIYT